MVLVYEEIKPPDSKVSKLVTFLVQSRGNEGFSIWIDGNVFGNWVESILGEGREFCKDRSNGLIEGGDLVWRQFVS